MDPVKDSDSKLLIRIDERLKAIERGFSNHLKHHFLVTMTLLAALLGLITALIFALI